jgi:hypothetical protein
MDRRENQEYILIVLVLIGLDFFLNFRQINSNKLGSGMDLIRNAKVVTLHNRRHGKYLLANENQESVTQGRNGSSRNARWTVELVQYSNSVILLKSCYNQYLTASDQHFLPGMSDFKVLQTRLQMPGNSLEWEPIREGTHSKQVKLKTHNGTFLRACGARQEHGDP